ncbi:MAG: SpaA isopeptide-forming pilin-related protein [Eubacteriales bacterium]
MKSTFLKKSVTILLVLLIILGNGFTALAATTNLEQYDHESQIPSSYGLSTLESQTFNRDSNSGIFDINFHDSDKKVDWEIKSGSRDNFRVKYVLVQGRSDKVNFYKYNESSDSTISDDDLRQYYTSYGIDRITVYYESIGNIKVIKYLDHEPNRLQLPVTFELRDAQGNKIEGTTSNGELIFTRLLHGTYTLKEIVPEGYKNIQNGECSVTVTQGTKVVKVINKKVGRLEVNKSIVHGDDADKAGIIFELYKLGSLDLVASGETDSEGNLLFDNLDPGFYNLKEVVPPGYESNLNELIQYPVVFNQTTKVPVVNTLITGGLKIIKTINSLEGNPQEGVSFKLYQGDVVKASGETNNEGILRFDGLVPGTYNLVEETPDGFESSIGESQSVQIIGRQTPFIYVVNTMITGDIEINKKDNDGNPQEGITFNLYPDQPADAMTTTVQTPWATGETDAQGVLRFEGLVPGNYLLEEEVPVGYDSSIDGMLPVTVIANESVDIDVVNTLITGNIKIIKTLNSEDGEPQEGITFELYNGDALVTTGETDTQGLLAFDELVPGEYQLKEVVPDGFESSIDGLRTVTVVGKQDTTINVVNTEIDAPEIDEPEEVIIEDEEMPIAPGKFPQTGGTPAFLFYGAGVGLTTLGTIIWKKRK